MTPTEAYCQSVDDETVQLRVPRSAVARALRTTSHVRRLDVNSYQGLVVTYPFPEFQSTFLSHARYSRRRDRPPALSYVAENHERRQAHLVVNRRLFLTAPGTSFWSFWGTEKFVVPDTWSFPDLHRDDARLLCLWLNSTYCLVQLLIAGVAIEGNWMKLHKYTLQSVLVPAVTELPAASKQHILATFDDLRTTEAPSVLKQLATPRGIRQRIDQCFRTVYPALDKIDITSVYGALVREFNALQASK